MNQVPQIERSASESWDEEAGSELSCSEDEYQGSKVLNEAMLSVRLGFIRKVYGILVAQILLTVVIVCPFLLVPRAFLTQNVWLYKFATWGSLAVIVGMTCCCRQAARSFPTNYLCLFVFTVFEAVVLGFITAKYETHSVLLAGGLTAAVFFGLTAYACFTKKDFTGLGPYLFAVLCGLVIWSFVMIFLPAGELTTKAFAGIGALLFCCYIVYDTQLIIGGRHKHQFEIDEYVFAALNIYLDIVNLFLMILRLLGSSSSNSS